MNKPPAFHPFRIKLIGDRVKIPRFAADESQGFYYGTVIRGSITYDGVYPGGNDLIVEWDEPVPFLGSYSGLNVAIKDEASPIWMAVDTWKSQQQFKQPTTIHE